jgi:hypothetical protein
MLSHSSLEEGAGGGGGGVICYVRFQQSFTGNSLHETGHMTYTPRELQFAARLAKTLLHYYELIKTYELARLA